MIDDLLVYRPWPPEIVATAISEFNYQMHSGADSAELAAGLHGLDFLTRASDLTDEYRARLEGAQLEARMRIELLTALEAEQRTHEENMERVHTAVKHMNVTLKGIMKMLERQNYTQEDIERIMRRREERKGN